MKIETERLFLRELKKNDLDMLCRVLGDKDIMQYYPYVFDKARVAEWIETNQRRYSVLGFGLWAVCLKEDGELIGDCGLTMQNINDFICPEIGYHIRKDQQHKGYGNEAASAVRDWAFSHTTFETLYCYMKDGNTASKKTAESIGMHYVETYRDKDGDLTCVYSMNRRDR